MAYYYKLGQIPPKRHTQYRQPDGSLYAEELVSSKGFSGIYSNLYHKHIPTRIMKMGEAVEASVKALEPYELAPLHLKTSVTQATGADFLEARVPLLFNNDLIISICNPTDAEMPYYYKNGEADEVLFFHEGAADIDTQFGTLEARPGDYVVIPRTTIYRIRFKPGFVRMLIIESSGPVETVKRYRNELGQLLEHSPYCERDIRPPVALNPEMEVGQYLVKVKKQSRIFTFEYETSPFDVIGWDGFLWPYCVSIHDFEPITGRIHQPPPAHQMFQAHGFVICSFVPRLFDYHPLAIPAPYNHSNIDSDEVLYYVDGNFMSRRGIDVASFTNHPGGLPHGPHPGTVEKSIGAKETHELAVMIDTFAPLRMAVQAKPFIDSNYPYSWIK